MKSIKISIILIIFLSFLELDAQYVTFSQYYASPMNLAPSFAGSVQQSRLSFNYRDQWAKIGGTFRTYSAAYDIHVPKVSSGFGVLLLKDEAGAGNLGRFELGVLYSWYGLLSKSSQLYFRPGVEFKLTQRSIDFTQLVFGDQLSAGNNGNPSPQVQPFPEFANKTYVDATASMVVYSPSFWVGTSIDHLFRPNDAFYNNPSYQVDLKYSFFGGYKFKMGANGHHGYGSSRIEDWFFVSGYYRMQSLNSQMDIGGYWDHLPFTLGIWVRGIPYLNITKTPNIDAVVALVGYKIYNFSIGYSFDMTVSPLIGDTGGSHEITITYLFAPNLKSKKRDGPLPCPSL